MHRLGIGWVTSGNLSHGPRHAVPGISTVLWLAPFSAIDRSGLISSSCS